MSPKTTTGRKALDRLLIVAAVAAVLVSVAAWIALNRPGGAAEAAGSTSSVSGSGGSFSETSGAPASGTSGSSDPATTAPEQSTSGTAGSTAAAGGSGTGTTGTRSGATPAPTPSATSGLSPTTAFLNALAASGLGPPVDDTQKLAMADDVCQELKNGSTYADVVRALTFAGASDEQAANFARLSITNLCPQFPAG